MTKRFLTMKQVAEKVRLSKTTIYCLMNKSGFPRSIALGPQKIVFLESDIDAWMLMRIADAPLGRDARVARATQAINSRKDRNRTNKDQKENRSTRALIVTAQPETGEL